MDYLPHSGFSVLRGVAMKILVAEDSNYFRKIVENTLLQWGYEVVLASDGLEAWNIL